MVLAILQARMSSNRLPGKVLKQINNKPILQYEIERVLLSRKIDKLVLATSINKDDGKLENFANKIGIDCFRGDLNNVLKRYYDCASYYNADTIVRITGDCPVIDASIIDKIIELHIKSGADYTSNTIYRTFPDGLDVEVFNFEILKEAYKNAKKSEDLEHVTKYIHNNIDKFNTENYLNDIDYSYIRWTLDTIDDFYFFKNIFDNIDDISFKWQTLLSKTNSAQKYLIDSNQTIRYAMKKLEEIVDDENESLYVIENRKLVGTLSTSDIRRALIYEDITNNMQVINVVNRDFKYLEEDKNYNKQDLKNLLKYKILPTLCKNQELKKLIYIKDLLKKPNKVVLMAGGLGSRLKELTENTPKPLLKVGEKSILEIIIDEFKKYNFYDFYISVNYKADKIIDYFENGKKLEIDIKYLKETKKLGTAGCLSLIEEELKEPIFVMNGDILTDIDFEKMLEFHKKNRFKITIAGAYYNSYIPYGVLKIKNNRLLEIEEKPIKRFLISGGIYIIDSDILKKIPKNIYFDMPMLIEKYIQNVGVFPIDGFWMDIGQIEDFYKAQIEYQRIKNDK